MQRAGVAELASVSACDRTSAVTELHARPVAHAGPLRMAVSSTSVAANSTAAGIPASCIITNSMSGSAGKPSDTPSSRSVSSIALRGTGAIAMPARANVRMPVTLGLSCDEIEHAGQRERLDGSAPVRARIGEARERHRLPAAARGAQTPRRAALATTSRLARVRTGCRSRDRIAVGVPLKQAVADVDRQIQPQARAVAAHHVGQPASRHILRCADAQRDIDCVAAACFVFASSLRLSIARA